METVLVHRADEAETETRLSGGNRRRWLALIVLCLGSLMIVLDSTIVNVALPSIRQDLGFSQTTLAWVVNAYLLTFGGFLLLGGARAVQGLGGAVVSAVSLSLIMNLFTEPADRAKAMGVFGFVAAGGGSIGVLLGGVLTSALNWHWVFLVNIPIGAAVCVFSLLLLPASRGAASNNQHLDIAGAITVTAALILAVYAIVNGNVAG